MDKLQLDVNQIQEIIPHRAPFLLVDRIIELEEGKRAVGIKNVTMNEPHFIGHFQGIRYAWCVDHRSTGSSWGCRITASREQSWQNRVLGRVGWFPFPWTGGSWDTLTLEVEITRSKGAFGKGKATAKVGDTVVAEGEIMFALSDPPQ